MGSFLEFRLRCRWVPATFDRVELVHEDSGERAEVQVFWLYRYAPREVLEGLYLKGQAELWCTPGVWHSLKTSRLVA